MNDSPAIANLKNMILTREELKLKPKLNNNNIKVENQ